MPLTTQDQIMSFLRVAGPVLPAKVAKNIKDTILIASAHLADLVARGEVKITYLKIGGSPLYYLSGQETQLYRFAAGNMNPKDLQVLNHLKSSQVLRESSLDTLSKVSLRSLQDFAVPLHVYAQDKRELFWKWFLLSEEETNQLIAQLLSGVSPPKIVEQTVPRPIVTVSEPTAKTELEMPGMEIVAPEIKPVKEPEPVVKPKRLGIKKKPELDKDMHLTEEEPEDDDLAELLLEESRVLVEQKKKELGWQTTLRSEKPTFLKKVKDKISGRNRVADKFLPVVDDFFHKLKITVEEKELIRKNSEIEFIVKISSVVGETTYFCKAKKKKRCDEKDISAAYMQAQIKKLPLLFIYTSELNQKARDMLETDAFKNALIKKIE